MSEHNSTNTPGPIDWQTDPEMHEGASAHDIMRVPATGHVDGVCLSKEPVGVRIHWWGGKSLPHLKHLCPACKAGNEHLWHGHIWFHVKHLNARYVLEFPSGAADAIKRELHRRGSLCGLPMRWTRKPQHIRGRVIVSFGAQIDPDFSMLPTPSLTAYLENMWGRHMRTCVAAEVDAPQIMSQAEQVRADLAAAGGDGVRRRGRGRAAKSPGDGPQTIADALRGHRQADILAALADVPKLNGHSADAS